MGVVTSFFGQNFITLIPYDSTTLFWGSIAFMVAATIALTVYFRRRGWL
jgi:Mg2+ and Co2+ transporter CorA